MEVVSQIYRISEVPCGDWTDLFGAYLLQRSAPYGRVGEFHKHQANRGAAIVRSRCGPRANGHQLTCKLCRRNFASTFSARSKAS